MAATVIVTSNEKTEETKKAKILQYLANNLSMTELERLGELGKSANAREMLNNNWAMLKNFC